MTSSFNGLSIYSCIFFCIFSYCVNLIFSTPKCSIPILMFSVCMPFKYPTISETLYFGGIPISIYISLDNILPLSFAFISYHSPSIFAISAFHISPVFYTFASIQYDIYILNLYVLKLADSLGIAKGFYWLTNQKH